MPRSSTQRALEVARKPWLKRTLLGLVIFVSLFALFGYFALPGIVRSQVEKIVAEKTHRQLRIERIDVQPFALAFQVHGATFFEADGKTVFVSFDELGVNLSVQSLLRFAPIVEDMWLRGPYVHLERRAANQYNFDDLLALNKPEPPKPDTGPARFALNNMRVSNGRIVFDDLPVKTQHVVSDLAFGVPFISSLPSQVEIYVKPTFSANVDGAPLNIVGQSQPFSPTRDTSIDLVLGDVDLTRFVPYLPFKPQFQLASAKLNMRMAMVFRQPTGKTPELSLKGTTVLDDVKIDEIGGNPLLRVPRLAVTLDDLHPLGQQLAVAKVELEGVEVDAFNSASGKLNLTRLGATGAPSTKPESPAPKMEAKVDASDTTSSLPTIALGEFALRDTRLRYRDERGDHPFTAEIKGFDLSVRDARVDLTKRIVDIGGVASTGANIVMTHDKRRDALAPATKPAANPAASPTAARSKDTGAPFTINIADIGIAHWQARIEDKGLDDIAPTTYHDIAFNAKGFSTAPAARSRIELQAASNHDGKLDVAGDVALAPLQADLKVNAQAFDLMPLQPYFTDRINMLVTRMGLSSAATLALETAKDGNLRGRVKGNAAIVNLATLDKVTNNEFLRWKSLGFNGIDVQLAPLSIAVDQIAIDDFFARVIIDPTGRINLQDVMRTPENQRKALATEESGMAPPTAAAEHTPLPATAAAAESAMPPIKIREVKLQRGRVRFTDNFIQPNYSASLNDLRGTVRGLSSQATSAANVDVQGAVNDAPLNIAGSINPLRRDLFLDLKASVKGMELGPLSPYSGKYIGYGIEKGKLSFEVAYHLDNRKLEAQNRIVLDQLTLGDKVESPTAVSLPIHLALKLLSDRNGVIDINLPIGGSLDDPKFSVGGIIFRAFVNLIAKAITAPFALIGSMFGGNAEELSWLEFDPGRAAIPQDGEKKLDTIAKALTDKPDLKLEITGHYDPQADFGGLKRAIVQHKVRALKVKQLGGKEDTSDPNSVVISVEEYPALLKKVYKDADIPGRPRNAIGLLKDIPVEEMEKLLADNTTVNDGDLVALGTRRAEAARDALVAKGIATDRIYIIASKPGDGDKAKPHRVDFSLR